MDLQTWAGTVAHGVCPGFGSARLLRIGTSWGCGKGHCRKGMRVCAVEDSTVSWNAPTISHEQLVGWRTTVDHEDFMKQVKEKGILAVDGVPGFASLRERLLLALHEFGGLPEAVQSKYCDKSSGHSFGWSRGVETFEGKPDLHKGSYYANPFYDHVKCTGERFDEYHNSNIWPEEVPDLEFCFKEMGSVMYNCATIVADLFDSYLAKELNEAYTPGRISQVLKQSQIPKARGLVYFPSNSQYWCGRHRDHGLLTGLVPGMFISNGVVVENPDPECGLYILSNDGESHRVALKKGSIAFQIGEVMQILSGGKLQATPHWVTPPRNGLAQPNTHRISFALFFQPNVDDRLLWSGEGDVHVECWENGMTFGEFAHKKTTLYAR